MTHAIPKTDSRAAADSALKELKMLVKAARLEGKSLAYEKAFAEIAPQLDALRAAYVKNDASYQNVQALRERGQQDAKTAEGKNEDALRRFQELEAKLGMLDKFGVNLFYMGKSERIVAARDKSPQELRLGDDEATAIFDRILSEIGFGPDGATKPEFLDFVKMRAADTEHPESKPAREYLEKLAKLVELRSETSVTGKDKSPANPVAIDMENGDVVSVEVPGQRAEPLPSEARSPDADTEIPKLENKLKLLAVDLEVKRQKLEANSLLKETRAEIERSTEALKTVHEAAAAQVDDVIDVAKRKFDEEVLAPLLAALISEAFLGEARAFAKGLLDILGKIVSTGVQGAAEDAAKPDAGAVPGTQEVKSDGAS